LAVSTAVGTASATPRHPLEYDALGDSYASGYGVPPYSATCGRSESAYPVQLDQLRKIELDDFVACAGATTASLVAGGQLAALDADTDLVTLSVGGNDIRWGDVVGACLVGTDEQCTAAITLTKAAITTVLPGLLDSVYDQVAAGAPHARVIVTGYPRLFSPSRGAYFGASPTEQEALNDGADLLNEVIARAAARHDFGFVGVTERFRGHAVNSTRPWILGLTDPGSFHPNAKGYRAYTNAVAAAVSSLRLRHCHAH
jgi:lysophospholipase L1-like esterase